MLRGVHTTRSVFASPSFSLDPLVGPPSWSASRVSSLQALFALQAAQHGLDPVPGLFVKSHLPFFSPEGGPGQTFFGSRTLELLAVVLRPGELAPEVRAALDALPERFDPGEAAAWEHFFRRFGTHFSDRAVAGGRLTVSARSTRNDERASVRALEEKLSFGGAASEEERDTALERAGLVERLSGEGGNEGGLPRTLRELSRRGFGEWSESVRKRPAMVRYGLRSVAELDGLTLGKKVALRQAVEAHLAARFAEWAAEHGREADLALERQEHLEDEASKLRAKRERILREIAQLEEEMEQARVCEQRNDRVKSEMGVCSMERKAYQKSLVDCETHSFNLEEALGLAQTCELELVACRLPKRRMRETTGEENKKRSSGQIEGAKEVEKEEEKKMEEKKMEDESETIKKRKDEAEKTKTTVAEEESIVSRLVGVAMVVALAMVLIVFMIKS